ncbi:50S ribosomal protein L28 [Candidatus Dependentiae bacterium]|nr:50S ribosomal protein L28 [Candidatus Dependentiae bacterium]MBU4387553.1 50S ribosomal protein L28 [Candidatus Dependentiae bacterium]MCG2756628.1 50S ribosomal protein L28 [Candidatus Dependentiae bacterium]
MANICVICDKRPQVVNNVSNANNKTKRWVYPNVHAIRYTLKGQKNVLRGSVCAKCLKSGKIEKVV